MRIKMETGGNSVLAEFYQQQEKLKCQVQAIELLEVEFLCSLWSEQPASHDQMRERFDRLAEALDKTGGLDTSLVLALFDKLEQRAFREINKPLALAQTIEPDRISQQCLDLPKTLITNVQAVHTYAYTTRRSTQARDASDARHLTNNQQKAAALIEWEATASDYKSRADFVRIIGKRDGIKERRLDTWIAAHEKSKA